MVHERIVRCDRAADGAIRHDCSLYVERRGHALTSLRIRKAPIVDLIQRHARFVAAFFRTCCVRTEGGIERKPVRLGPIEHRRVVVTVALPCLITREGILLGQDEFAGPAADTRFVVGDLDDAGTAEIPTRAAALLVLDGAYPAVGPRIPARRGGYRPELP